jgi:hypothetical protein
MIVKRPSPKVVLPTGNGFMFAKIRYFASLKWIPEDPPQ